MLQPILLIGVGNEYRCDDGVGLAVIRALKKQVLPENILFIESSGDGAELMELWSTAWFVILFDAVSSGATPGTIYCFDALKQRIPAQLVFQSTHAFGITEAIELARILDQFPPSLIVYAIEGQNFSSGIGLTSEVQNAMHKVVEQVKHEVHTALHQELNFP
jgi:hydrogenase maturation protease